MTQNSLWDRWISFKDKQRSEGRKEMANRIKTPVLQLNYIMILHSQNFSVNQIVDKLKEEFGSEARTKRVVQRMIQGMGAKHQTQWQRHRTKGEDCALIADAMGAVWMRSGGKKTEPTQEEVEWLIWICKRVPTLPPYYQWVMATMYRIESLKPQPEYARYESFLNLKPWESNENMMAYNQIYNFNEFFNDHFR